MLLSLSLFLSVKLSSRYFGIVLDDCFIIFVAIQDDAVSGSDGQQGDRGESQP